MPQVTRYTATPAGYVIATMQAQIDALVTNMNAGLDIQAADVAMLVGLYNDFIAHYHTTSDLRGVDTFGNRGYYGAGTYVTSTSAAAVPTAGTETYPPTVTGTYTASTVPGVVVDGEITYTDINNIISLINTLRHHTHDIADDVS